MPGTLDNKVALVSVGASGIGRATALTFAREGAKLITHLGRYGRCDEGHTVCCG